MKVKYSKPDFTIEYLEKSDVLLISDIIVIPTTPTSPTTPTQAAQQELENSYTDIITFVAKGDWCSIHAILTRLTIVRRVYIFANSKRYERANAQILIALALD